MKSILTLLILCCAALTAADPVAVSGAALAQAKAEQEYRSYLTALAKAYQTETAKFEAQLKRDATAAKKDPDALAAVTALQEKVKAGKQLGDLSELIDGKLLGGDAVAVDKIAGGADLLVGKWNVKTPENQGFVLTLILTINANRKSAVFSSSSTYMNNAGNSVTTHPVERGMTVTVTDSLVTIEGVPADPHYEIKLPLPLTGDIPATSTIRSGNGDVFVDHVTFERIDPAPVVAK